MILLEAQLAFLGPKIIHMASGHSFPIQFAIIMVIFMMTTAHRTKF